MIPLGDAERKPLHFPIMTVFIIVLNTWVFILELIFGDVFVIRWSLIPANIIGGKGWETILSSIFLHAGIVHLGSNMLFFWVFGPDVEDVMGSVRYLLFYILGGLTATFAQLFVDPTSTIPNLGASGAIASVLGVFLVTYPHDNIRTILLFGWFVSITRIPAILLVGLWFLMQVFSEFTAVMMAEYGGVAYMAHITGFLFGALAGRFFETSSRRLDQELSS